MRMSMIVAMAQNHVIGINHQMPWHLSADLKRFREITMGKPILMGRRTYASIGRALPGRTNIVLTHDRSFHAEGCVIAHSIEASLEAARGADELMIIGGSALYDAFLSTAQRLYLTLIHRSFEGDTLFPAFDWNAWEVSQEEKITDDPLVDFSYSFLTLDKRPGA